MAAPLLAEGQKVTLDSTKREFTVDVLELLMNFTMDESRSGGKKTQRLTFQIELVWESEDG